MIFAILALLGVPLWLCAIAGREQDNYPVHPGRQRTGRTSEICVV